MTRIAALLIASTLIALPGCSDKPKATGDG